MAQITDGGRRSVFLVLAAIIANIYLVAFAADAGLSLVEELFRGATGSETLLAGRKTLALAVVLGTFAMIVVVVFAPHLPKLVLLPPIAFALWAAFGAPPLGALQNNAAVSIAVVALQVGLAALAFYVNKRRTGAWFIAASRLPRLKHLVLRTAFSAIILVILLPVALLSLTVAGTAAYLEQETEGFVDFTASDIKLRERIFEKDNKRVVIVGMMHFGESDFYDTLFAEFPSDALVLAEGVTDRDNRLSNSLSYQRLARVLGLEQQPFLAPSPALNEDGPDMGGDAEVPTGGVTDETVTDETMAEVPADVRIANVRPDVLYADADLADFSDSTIAFLNDTATIYDATSAADAVDRITALGNQYTEEEIEQVYEDIIYGRNKKVIAALDEQLAHYDTIIIPWGAMHMPEIDAALRDRAFSQVSERQIPLIRYETIFESLRERS